MPAGLYRFHCVGEGDAVFDSVGCRLRTLTQVRAQADRVAIALMEQADAEWTRWIVDVHDAKGRRVLARAFTDAKFGADSVA